MGRKKTPDPVPPGTRLIRLELSDEDHHALRVVAANAGMSMAAYARALVSQHVREESTRRDEKS